MRKTSVALAKKRAELEESRATFHREGYDDPRGRFSNGPDIGDIIGGVIGGMLTSRNLNDAFGRGWSAEPRLGGDLRRRPALPERGSSSRPSSPSRPSSRGGFRTGGRF